MTAPAQITNQLDKIMVLDIRIIFFITVITKAYTQSSISISNKLPYTNKETTCTKSNVFTPLPYIIYLPAFMIANAICFL